MNELTDAIYECILNNSNQEAKEGDSVLIDGLDMIEKDNNIIHLYFNDGTHGKVVVTFEK